MNSRLVELLIVVAAVLAPTFFLANKIDSDEFFKAGGGVALGGIVLGAYRLFLGKRVSNDA